VGDARQSREGALADASDRDNGGGATRGGRGGLEDDGIMDDGIMEDASRIRWGGRSDGDTTGDGGPLQVAGPGPANGFWADAEWLPCSDGKARPTQPGILPLVNGHPQRVARLRAIGNAIVPAQAAEFIRAALEVL
jgi:DNA (cytosine-5)-methyltransferase 1